jgi:cell fate regulator YaaT (PSP1 superfamily)
MSNGELTFLKTTKINDENLFDGLPEFDFPEGQCLADVAGIKLHDSDPIMPFDCRDMYLKKDDDVVVETKRGLTLGKVVCGTQRRYIKNGNLPRVIRKMSHGDIRQMERNRDKEDAAHRLCLDRIERLKLSMKLVDVEYLHGGNKAVFYFSADGRVDFRELVRDLAQRLHTRIEMRQIGVRDVARKVGGIGVCGCQLCCNLYLRDFKPISIRMAKDQNLVLNPQKVSGVCGRLLCCLTYENVIYREAAKGMPKIGRRVTTPHGEGRIRDRDVLKRMVRVQLAEETILREYPLDQIQTSGGRHEEEPVTLEPEEPINFDEFPPDEPPNGQ